MFQFTKEDHEYQRDNLTVIETAEEQIKVYLRAKGVSEERIPSLMQQIRPQQETQLRRYIRPNLEDKFPEIVP